MEEAKVRAQLREWIGTRSKKKLATGELTDELPIIESGILSSLDIAEFVLYIESLLGDEIDMDDLEPEAFTNIDSMWQTFFAARA